MSKKTIRCTCGGLMVDICDYWSKMIHSGRGMGEYVKFKCKKCGDTRTGYTGQFNKYR